MAGVDEEYMKEIEKARRELCVFIKNNIYCAPLMLQLAWNDAATYDARSKTGGPDGSIRFRIEQELKKEASMHKAVQYCEIVKTKLKKVSYADLYQLAGVVAIEVTKGPTIDFVPGRKDSYDLRAEQHLEYGEEANKSCLILSEDWDEFRKGKRLFLNGKEDASILRGIFARMGLIDDKVIVALCGGHTLVRTMYPKLPMVVTLNDETCEDRSAFKKEGKWTKELLKFDNSYFKELLSKNASFSRLPMDYALIEDEKFCHYVEQYAKDNDIFLKEYAISHKKLSELGCNLKRLTQPNVPNEKLNQHKGLIGIGVVSIVATVIFGYFLKRKKKLKN